MRFRLIIIFLYFSSITLYCQQDSLHLEEVIISANKTEETIKKVAQQVKVISAREISLQQAQTPADLLQMTGAAFVQKSQQGGGSPVIRGFEANKVLLMIDGVRMNNAIYRGGHLQNVITMDNNAMERVEVLYGPSSTMYGSDALGGVIHFYTKKPKFSSGDSVELDPKCMVRFGTVNKEKTANVSFNIGGKRFATYTSITASSFGDLVMGKKINPSYGKAFGERNYYVERIDGKDSLVANTNKYKQVFSRYGQLDIIQKLSHKISEKTTHGINFQLSTSTDIPRYDRLTDPSATTILNQAEWYYGPQKRTMIAYDLNSLPNNESSYHIGVNYQAIEESRINRRFGSANQNNRIENLNIFGFYIDLLKIMGKHKLRYGVDAQLNDLKSTAFVRNIRSNVESPLDTRYPDGKNKYNQMGLYLSHSADFNEKVTINDGVRIGLTTLHSTFVSKAFFPFPFDEAKQNNFTYSANAGINYLIKGNSKISANIATGFRAPNIDDLGKIFETTPNTLIVPNTKLKPEQSINVDLSSIIGLGNKSYLQAVVFATQLSDAIVVGDATFNGQSEIEYNGQKVKVLSSQNKNKANITGFSTALNLAISKSISFDANATYTKGVILDDKDTPLDHIPPFYLKSGLQYSVQKYSFNIIGLYNGWKRIKDYNPNGEDNQQYATPEGMPSWFTLNLKARLQLNEGIAINCGIDNVFDLQYRNFASGINAPGRNFYLAFRYGI